MRHIKSVLTIATMTLAILLTPTLPAIAQTPVDSLVFFPVPNGPGGTYSCSSSPPFISDPDSPEPNCTHYQTGTPDSLVCDIPTTITFVPSDPEVPQVREYVADGLLCH